MDRDADPAGPQIDVELAAAGLAVAAPLAQKNPLISSAYEALERAGVSRLAPELFGSCSAIGCDVPTWSGTTTADDPGRFAFDGADGDDVAFAYDVAECVADLVATMEDLPSLSSELYAMGESQGGKAASLLGCTQPREGWSIGGVFVSGGLFAEKSSCSIIGPPPALIVFQAQDDTVAPFCTYFAFAPTALPWSVWATEFNRCAAAAPSKSPHDITEPVLDTLCPRTAARQLNATIVQRAYVNTPACLSPMALFFTNERRSSAAIANGHLWPGMMEAFGQRCGGACVAARFFGNLAGGREAFAGLLDGLLPCSDGSLSFGRRGPCGGAPQRRKPGVAFLTALGGGIQNTLAIAAASVP